MTSSENLKDQLHLKVVNLEREIRDTELILQQKRSSLQKMAEIISSNVNRTIVGTLSKFRLGDTMILGTAK